MAEEEIDDKINRAIALTITKDLEEAAILRGEYTAAWDRYTALTPADDEDVVLAINDKILRNDLGERAKAFMLNWKALGTWITQRQGVDMYKPELLQQCFHRFHREVAAENMKKRAVGETLSKDRQDELKAETSAKYYSIIISAEFERKNKGNRTMRHKVYAETLKFLLKETSDVKKTLEDVKKKRDVKDLETNRRDLTEASKLIAVGKYSEGEMRDFAANLAKYFEKK